MRKKVVLFIILFLILIGVILSVFLFFNNKIDNNMQKKQNQIIKNIGVSKNDYYVYNNGSEYYVYNITGDKYVCYFYKMFTSKKKYNEYKDEYRGDIKANLFYDDESLFTRIKVSSGVVEDGFVESLDNRHQGFKKLT